MKTTLLFSFILYTTFVTAQQTYVPDDNFEQALIDQGYDNLLDDYVATANISGITHLYIGQKGISDLTGIEDFTSLEELQCFSNQLTSLDLSQNTNLKVLDCVNNQLTSLNISQCILIEELYVGTNQLTTLDVSQNTALVILLCGSNQLATLNVSPNINLKILICDSNQLTSLDVTQNTLLKKLSCGHNQISSLNINQCTLLESLMADSNSLTSLDLTQNVNINVVWIRDNQFTQIDVRNGNNTAINGFWTTNNPNLTCIFVEDTNYSANNPGWKKDTTSHYVETQVECDNLAGINDILYKKIKIYPNPVKNVLHIGSEFSIENSELILMTVLGKKVHQSLVSGREIEIDISHLESGIYFLTIQNHQKQSLTTKIIKL